MTKESLKGKTSPEAIRFVHASRERCGQMKHVDRCVDVSVPYHASTLCVFAQSHSVGVVIVCRATRVMSLEKSRGVDARECMGVPVNSDECLHNTSRALWTLREVCIVSWPYDTVMQSSTSHNSTVQLLQE